MTGTADGRRDFFISFTGADRPWARWLVCVLREEGYSFWFQDQDFAGSIPRSIAEAHANSRRTILVLSEAYAKSGYCRSEWEMRYQEDPGGANDLLIPFRVDPSTPSDPLLRRIAYTDLFTYADETAAREQVRHRLRKAVEPGHRMPLGDAPFPGGRRVDAPFPVPPHNLPQPNRAFVGRTAELEALRKALTEAGRTAITQPQAITGLGGIGKTQLALRYAYAHLGDYDLIRWLRAEEPGALAADYAGLAPALGLDPDTPDQAALIAAVRGQLERRPRFLLVFDNVTEPASLDRYLPRTGTGHVLITSRHQDWDGTARALELDVMAEDEATALLLGEEAADPARRAAAAELAEEFGCLPLALAQARAFMSARKVDIAGYRQQLVAARPKVLAWRPPNAAYPLAVAQAWEASVKAAAEDCPAARELLELLAFLAPDAIPRDLLGADLGALPEDLRDPFDRDGAIEALYRFSLLRADVGTLTVHRLIQAVTRDGLDEATAKARAEAAVRLVSARLPRPPQEHTNWPTIGTLLPHALAAAEVAERLGAGMVTAATVLNETALYRQARAAWDEAEPLYRRATSIGERTLGPDHPDVAASLNNLATLYQATGRYAEAEPLYRRALAISEKALGPENPDLAAGLNNLAELYRATGRYAEAEPLHPRALAIREKALGPEHPDVAQSLNNLANLYQDTGRFAEAEPLYRCAIGIGERTLGPEHPDMATWLYNLALLYRATGRFAEAEPLLRCAVAIIEKTLPPDHPHQALFRRHHAALLAALGRSGGAP